MLTIEKVMSDLEPLDSSTDSVTGRETVSRSGRERLAVKDGSGRYIGMMEADSLGGDTCGSAAEECEPMRASDTPAALLRLFAEQGSDTVAVVDDEGSLLGMADRLLTLRLMSTLTGADAPGATISVSMRQIDYEAGRLTSIVEMSGAKVVSLLTEADNESVTAYVKIAQENPYPAVESLERHGYAAASLTGSYRTSAEDDEVKRNYAALMEYLNIGRHDTAK